MYNRIMERNVVKILIIVLLVFINNNLFPKDTYHHHWYIIPPDQDYVSFYIFGNVLLKKFYGPPNYGETPEEDEIEFHYILQLYDPITFSKGFKTVTVEEIQLIFYNDEIRKKIDLNWIEHVIGSYNCKI